MTDTLNHGTLAECRSTPPGFGDFITHDKVQVSLIPAQKMEVHFKANVDVFTMCLGPKVWRHAYNTDKVTRREYLPGDFVYHPVGSKIYAMSEDTCHETIVVYVDPSFRDAIGADSPFFEPSLLNHGVRHARGKHTRDIACLIRKMHLSGLIQDKLAAQSVVMTAMSDAFCALKTSWPETPRQNGLTRISRDLVFDLIDARLSERFGVHDLAQAVNLSTYHFVRSFKDCTGLSPYQYVLERRITRARKLLSDVRKPLVDVAYEAGFSSQAHMTDVFRKRLGITPGAYRRVRAK